MLGIYQSTNNGSSFATATTGLTSNWIQSFTFCGSRVFAGSGEAGVFVSTNKGTNWSAVNSGLYCLDIAALASDGSNIFAGTADSGVYVSSNYGSGWTQVNNGLTSKNITALKFVNGYLFAGTISDGIFISNNNGTTWNSQSNGLPLLSNIRCFDAYDTVVFAGTGDGEIFASYNYGNNWISINNGLSGSPVLSLCSSGNYLYAGINAGGVWKRPLSEILATKEINNDESNISVYPNPAINYLTIETLLKSTFDILNIQGQIVLQQPLQKGKTKIDIEGLAKGIYILKLNHCSKIIVTKIVKE